jgi:hypothetical protein
MSIKNCDIWSPIDTTGVLRKDNRDCYYRQVSSPAWLWMVAWMEPCPDMLLNHLVELTPHLIYRYPPLHYVFTTRDSFDGWREFGNRCRQFKNRRRDTFGGWREFGNRCWQFENRRQGTCTERYANLLHRTVLKQTMRAFDGGRRRQSRTIKRTCFFDGGLTGSINLSK